MRRLRRLAPAAIAGAVAAAAVLVAYSHLATYRAWGSLGPVPSHVDWCGRRYHPAAATLTRAQVDAQVSAAAYPAQLEEVARTPWGRPILAAPMSAADQARFHTSVCAMAVYLTLGPDSFRPYGLSGGP